MLRQKEGEKKKIHFIQLPADFNASPLDIWEQKTIRKREGEKRQLKKKQVHSGLERLWCRWVDVQLVMKSSVPVLVMRDFTCTFIWYFLSWRTWQSSVGLRTVWASLWDRLVLGLILIPQPQRGRKTKPVPRCLTQEDVFFFMYKPVLNELFKSVICDFLQKGIEEEFCWVFLLVFLHVLANRRYFLYFCLEKTVVLLRCVWIWFLLLAWSLCCSDYHRVVGRADAPELCSAVKHVSESPPELSSEISEHWKKRICCS